MKIQLYTIPGFSGPVGMLRKLDGVWTSVSDSTMQNTDYINVAGHPVDQNHAERRVKYPLLTCRSMARFYGIPDDVELYD